MKYKIVKLKNLKEEYKKLGLGKDSLGLLLDEKQGKCLIMFFNNVNQGDYLVLVVNRSDLDITDMVLPNNLCKELEEYIENNADKIANKTGFEVIPFNECDEVELIVEKEKYFKFGVHKGDKGVIASNKATKNKILVDFGKEAEDFDGFISVDFEDIKKVEE
jgi:hypothetical protein